MEHAASNRCRAAAQETELKRQKGIEKRKFELAFRTGGHVVWTGLTYDGLEREADFAASRGLPAKPR